MNLPWVALRAPWGLMQGAAPLAMGCHRRGAATPQQVSAAFEKRGIAAF